MRITFICAVLFWFMTWGISAQAQYLTSAPHIGVQQVPIGDEVYDFLRHLSVREIIHGYSEAELPISEYDVVQFLREADSSTDLSLAERELLTKYLRTYAHEPRHAATLFSSNNADQIFFDGLFTQEDKYLYRWFDDSSHSDLFVDGIASAEARRQSDPVSESVGLLNIGGRFSGTLSGEVGYFMQTTNGEVIGNHDLALEDPLLSKNHDLRYFSQQFFDFTTAELDYNKDWFTGKIAREAVAIGGGYENDNVILSADGVPTYDFASLGAHVGAVRYQAILGSLVSDNDTSLNPYPNKYLALHDLTFAIGNNLELGFTDIMVFSYRLELGYLSPFAFLNTIKKGLDDEDHDNALLATHGRWNIAPGLEVRGQFLLDDLVASKIGTGYWSNKWAWQLGAMWADPFGIPNLDWKAEWMYVKPYLYTHWDGEDAYTNSQTLLGAQIGPNSISYWTGLRWTPDAKWAVSLQCELIEKGENLYDSTGKLLYNAGADYRYSYEDSTNSSFSQTDILNGRRVDIFNLTLQLEYEPWRDILFYINGTKTFVDYLQESPVTPGFNFNGLPVSQAPQTTPETIFAFGISAFF
ncbi:MAG TPA: hypothetical protein VGM92_13325 [Candidatus Kapabacteria bacterium]|jgi:hypothetical protein